MKTLDERLSAIITPYDDVDFNQEDLIYQQHQEYMKDAVLEHIGTSNFKIEFDLHFDSVMSELSDEDKNLFVRRCVIKICEQFNLNGLLSKLESSGDLDNDISKCIEFIRYFAHDMWVEDIAVCLPKIDIEIIKKPDRIKDLFTAHFLDVMNKIKTSKKINQYVRYYFEFASLESGVETLLKMMSVDETGLITAQVMYM